MGHGEPPGAGAAKVDAETLALRAKPRPVTRINRRVLILLSGTGLLLIFGATIFALDPPRLFDRNETGRELIRTDNTPTPEGLEGLPRNYGDLPKPVELGPPLPGDLGGAILDKERELGVGPSSDLPFRPNPEDDAARAERIRQARLASQGRESGVFFQLSTRTKGATNTPATIGNAVPAPGPAERNPFDGLRTAEADQGLGLDLANDQNLQGRKLDFLKQGVEENIYNPHALQDPASLYQVMAGTIIPASLVTGVNSDLPGRVIAQVTENVYDTVSGRFLLIPQRARHRNL
ncbi:hypothetical protein JCM17846_32470 [Iodidimonas nitroreducens]|uniref:Conjugal transfer protein TrbI n=1 Tax=Iodidimonas nitroreducens TaxID=1236968 RepID=A0A5A7ND64_9PROT|nr:hypothetical protein JCM17846_32470 [Iodidimonas nitroreducens]